jgi:hypothetical protein
MLNTRTAFRETDGAPEGLHGFPVSRPVRLVSAKRISIQYDESDFKSQPRQFAENA